MPILLFYLFFIFEYQEIGGSNSATQLASIGNSPYLATATNPAVLGLIDKNGFGIVYCRPYEISQIQYHRLSANYKNFGLSFSRFGQTGYQEFKFALSVGSSFNTNLCYGIIIKGLYLDLADYGQSLIPAMNVGIAYKINKLKVGAVLQDLNNPKILSDEMPRQILVGTIWEPVSDLLLGLEVQKGSENENITFGTEIKPLSMLAIRLGMQVNPFIISGGIGLVYKNTFFDYALKFHQQLRQSSIFSIGYFW
ncbi:MAG: hypothetical protein ABIK19_06335 [candidate division WOR-3 bacterium]